MGKKDTKAKEYMSDNHRFADLCNFVLYNGEKKIRAEDLKERDSTEVLSVLGVNGKEILHEQKWRDLLRTAIMKVSGSVTFVLIGLENQSDIHYAMAVKSMIYDAINYGNQVNEAGKRHKHNRNRLSGAEFLSGFAKTDRLTPIIPITLYLGPEKWDAPTSLHEMFGMFDQALKPFIPDYKINLVTPESLSKTDLNKFSTDMKEVLGAIKYSLDPDEFENFITEDENFKQLTKETAEAINIFVETEIETYGKEGPMNMCKAIEGIKQRAAEKAAEEVTEKMNKAIEGIKQRAAEEAADREMVRAIENVMKNLKSTLEEACTILNCTADQYHEAKERLLMIRE